MSNGEDIFEDVSYQSLLFLKFIGICVIAIHISIRISVFYLFDVE